MPQRRELNGVALLVQEINPNKVIEWALIALAVAAMIAIAFTVYQMDHRVSAMVDRLEDQNQRVQLQLDTLEARTKPRTTHQN